jgi:NTP pyrophosphatase (non-canonical NTP hydrolase)
MKTTINGHYLAGTDRLSEILYAIDDRMQRAEQRYGPIASTHEALGVALEEWDELREAVRSNADNAIEWECLDLAAVLIRLAQAIGSDERMLERSRK